MTFADLKRRLVPGAVLATHYPQDPFGKGDPPERAIVRGKTSLVMEATDWSRGQTSHWQMPKASEVTILGPDSFSVHPGTDMERQYTIVRDAS